MGRRPPQVHAMLVCDQAFQQAGSGKWCVIGTHDQVLTTGVPFVHPLAVFLALGDFEGGTRFQIVMRHQDGDELCKVEAETATIIPFGNFDCGVPFPQFPLARTGEYRFELQVAGKVLATRTLRVEMRQR